MRSAILPLAAAVVLSSFGESTVAQNGQFQSDVQLRTQVLASIRDGVDYLKRNQNGDGSWSSLNGQALSQYRTGITALAVLALINCDEPVDSPAVRNGVRYLRSLPANEPSSVYEASLWVMALCAVGDKRDQLAISQVVALLEETQEKSGPLAGLWGYDLVGRGSRRNEDRSNGQFAILALRDAAYAGFKVDREVWQRTHEHWLRTQDSRGGWSYKPGDSARGSMTAAGLSTLAITTRMLQDDSDCDAAGRPDCCASHPPPNAFEKGRKWLADRFTVFSNPGSAGGVWHYYYLYGIERAARLGNVRYFGEFDWYRHGARFLVKAQKADGSWWEKSMAAPVTTSFAVLFLSKGLSRVVVNKLDYTSVGIQEDVRGEWNRHPSDVPNLIEMVDGLDGWPPRLTGQVLSLNRLDNETALVDLNQAPVTYISGRDAPRLTDEHVRWLREYIDEGGFIFAVANCGTGSFDNGFRQLIDRLFPDGDASLQRLQPDHPIFRSEFRLDSVEGIELYGVDFGCRTAIVYSPTDLACYWQKWMRHPPKGRSPALAQRIIRANRIGTNILAYATGREPPVKLNDSGKKKSKTDPKINRGLTEIAQLKHTGGWDTAPKALANLLEGLNQTVGMDVSTRRRTIQITLEELQRFPIVYMHGRYRFSLSQAERDSLRDHLSRGGVLIADACCGSERFDRSFRDLIAQMYPDNPLERIPLDHEIYSETIGRKIESVGVRKLVRGSRTAAMEKRTERMPPNLEGVKIDGRYAVLYSRYDISCALENQASLACDGYIEEDAMKLAINMVLYAMIQDVLPVADDSP